MIAVAEATQYVTRAFSRGRDYQPRQRYTDLPPETEHLQNVAKALDHPQSCRGDGDHRDAGKAKGRENVGKEIFHLVPSVLSW